MPKPDRTKGNAPAVGAVEASAQQTPYAKEFDMNGSTALRFQETAFDVVDRNGQPWLRGTQIADALGYVDEKAINKIYSRHSEEFGERMSVVVNLAPSGNLINETRIFSLRGAHLLAMFARTERAVSFRRWVLDILDRETAVPPAPTLPATKTITTAQAGELVTLIAERFPDGRSRGYAWSRFNAHFRIARYRELPVSRFAEACAYIRGMPAKDGSDPALSLIASRVENARFMLTFNEEGRIMLREIGEDVALLRFADISKAVAEPGGVPLKHLPDIINACADRLGAATALQQAA